MKKNRKKETKKYVAYKKTFLAEKMNLHEN